MAEERADDHANNETTFSQQVGKQASRKLN